MSRYATVASIADMQFRFNKEDNGFQLTILANDPTGKPLEIILGDDIAIGVADNIIFAIEQNEIRAAKIAAGGRVIDEPEIRTFGSSESQH